MQDDSQKQDANTEQPLLVCSLCGAPENHPNHDKLMMRNQYHEFIDPRQQSQDLVNHPPHYTQHPSGVECIQITEHMNFCLGNALKYIWRADLKNGIEDLEKAEWYIQREIDRRSAGSRIDVDAILPPDWTNPRKLYED